MIREQSTTDWLHLMRAEYLEMPGLQLTKRQIQRLWGLDADMCDALVDRLLTTQFLRRTDRDLYVLHGPVC